jgi:hypothetical protein
MMPGSTKALLYGGGPCCDTVYGSYAFYDFATGNASLPYVVPNYKGFTLSWVAVAQDGRMYTLYGWDEYGAGPGFLLGTLDPSSPANATIGVESPIQLSSFIFPFSQLWFDDNNNYLIVGGVQGEDENSPYSLFYFDVKTWTLVKSIPVGKLKGNMQHNQYDPLSRKIYGVTGTPGYAPKYLIVIDIDDPGKKQPHTGLLVCDYDENCDFSGCTVEPGSETLTCSGAITAICQNGNFGIGVWSIETDTGGIIKSPAQCHFYKSYYPLWVKGLKPSKRPFPTWCKEGDG